MDLMVPGIPVSVGARTLAPAAQMVWGEPSGLFIDFANKSMLIKGGGFDWSGLPGDKLTCTRSGTATVIGPAGARVSVSANALRYQYDPTTLQSLGLLVEEQRTNLLLNADTLSTQNVTVTAAAHTLSFEGTGTVTLSGTSTAGPLVGTGTGPANRVSLTFTPTAGTLTLTVSGSVTFAQLELGAFATSYTPTAGSQVTRSADQISIATSLFPFSATAGTMVAKFSSVSSTVDFIAASIDGGSISNRFMIYVSSGTVPRGFIASGGVTQANINVGTYTSPNIAKLGLTWQANDAQAAFNGAVGTQDTSVSLPTVSNLQLGRTANSAAQLLNGIMREFVYIPRRISDAELLARVA